MIVLNIKFATYSQIKRILLFNLQVAHEICQTVRCEITVLTEMLPYFQIELTVNTDEIYHIRRRFLPYL